MPNINEFKSRLRGGGARANQFKVTLPFLDMLLLVVKHLILLSYVEQLLYLDKQ